MQVIDAFAQDWFRWMFDASWQLALLVIVVASLVWLLRSMSHTPRLRHALWLLVLVKVFLPPSFALPIGIGSWGIAPIVGSKSPYQRVFGGSTELAPLAAAAGTTVGAATQASPTAASRLPLVSVLMFVWALGAILFWLLVFDRYRTLARSIRGTPTIDEGPVRVALEKSAIALEIDHSPELRVTAALASPLLFGVVHPCVVLPAQFVADASPTELSAVLTHELVHFRRRDTWIGWLQVVAQGLFWFHPFVWWASSELRHQREEACDESVLCDGGIAPDTYGESMMRVLTSAKARSLADGRFVGVFERGTNLQVRLEQIMNYEPKTRSFGLTSKLAVALVAAVLLPMAPGITGPLEAQEAATADSQREQTPYPQIVQTVPEIGATEVKISTKALRVTFDRDMGQGMSWTGGPPQFPPTDKSRDARWINDRTCVLPVKLQRGKFYRVGINSKSHRNFRASDGTPIPPIAWYFVTEGATSDVIAQAKMPEIVKLDPENGATEVDPNLKGISVTFNIPMGAGMSWAGGGPAFPEIPDGQRPSWSQDQRTCTLPVTLKSGHKYQLGLNSLSHNNFQSAAGIPLPPVIYEFETK